MALNIKMIHNKDMNVLSKLSKKKRKTEGLFLFSDAALL